MLAISAIEFQDQSQVSSCDSVVKDGFENYRALGIKLHMLADECPVDFEQQNISEQRQREYIEGQITEIETLKNHEIHTADEAKLMIALWTEEVLNAQSDSDLSDMEKVASNLFNFFQKQL